MSRLALLALVPVLLAGCGGNGDDGALASADAVGVFKALGEGNVRVVSSEHLGRATWIVTLNFGSDTRCFLVDLDRFESHASKSGATSFDGLSAANCQ